MYSPKIKPDLIPLLYRLGKARGIPMTTLVHRLLVKALQNEELPDEIKTMMPELGWTNTHEQILR